ncbi:MAG: hypothetical protein OXC80_14485 [Gammaproteobacteria bacterium]|nr:hypothetical protein [Gammaproteobacteria bacterium]
MPLYRVLNLEVYLYDVTEGFRGVECLDLEILTLVCSQGNLHRQLALSSSTYLTGDSFILIILKFEA